MPVEKIVIIIVMWIIWTILCIGVSYNIGVMNEIDQDEPIGERNNGWLARPFKRFACGAIHGHKWKKSGPVDSFGNVIYRCELCGKEAPKNL